MNKLPDVARLQETLKELIHARGLSYSDVAAQLGMSLPTMKRYMTNEDISIEQISAICGCLGVTFLDLVKLAFDEKPNESTLTAEQEDFLIRNPDHCVYLVALKDGYSPRAIEHKFKLTRQMTEKYLLALDKLNFIQYGPGQQVKLKIGRFINLMDSPKLRAMFYEHMLNVAPAHFKARLSSPGSSYMRFDFFSLTEKSYSSLQQDLEAIHAKYLVSTKYESLRAKDQAKKVTYIAMCDLWQHPDFQDIQPKISQKRAHRR